MTPRRLAALLLCCLFALPAPAQQAQPSDPPADKQPEPDPRLASPRATMETFLDAMSGVYTTNVPDDAVVCLGLPDSVRRTEAGRGYARQLVQVFAKLGDIHPERMPGREEARDLTSYTVFPNADLVRPDPEEVGNDKQRIDDAKRAYDIVLAERPRGVSIELAKDDSGAWRFDANSLEQLPELLDAIGDLPNRGSADAAPTTAQQIRAAVPRSLRGSRVIGLEPWQWIGLLVMIGAGVVLDFTVRSLIASFWRRLMKKRGTEPDADRLKRAVRPFGLLAAAVVWYLALNLLGLPPSALFVLLAAVRIFFMLAAVWAGFRITDLACEYLAKVAHRSDTKYDDLLIPLLRKTLKVFVAAAGVIYIADAFDVQILPLLTGLGIGGLAFAFAAKDTIENFFGSVSVILDRPFEVGDWVQIDGTEGTVESLGLRSTRIRTFYNSLITVPNATLVRARVDNYGRRRYRRFKTHVAITYDTPPDTIESFCAGIREIIRLHPYTRKDYYHVWLNQWGPSSLDVLVYMFHECPDWSTELRERHRFMLDVIRLADRLGVSFAFPTQTLHLYNEEHGVEHAPADSPDASAERNARDEGRAAARELTDQQGWKTSRPTPVTFDSTGAREDDGTEARET